MQRQRSRSDNSTSTAAPRTRLAFVHGCAALGASRAAQARTLASGTPATSRNAPTRRRGCASDRRAAHGSGFASPLQAVARRSRACGPGDPFGATCAGASSRGGRDTRGLAATASTISRLLGGCNIPDGRPAAREWSNARGGRSAVRAARPALAAHHPRRAPIPTTPPLQSRPRQSPRWDCAEAPARARRGSRVWAGVREVSDRGGHHLSRIRTPRRRPRHVARQRRATRRGSGASAAALREFFRMRALVCRRVGQ